MIQLLTTINIHTVCKYFDYHHTPTAFDFQNKFDSNNTKTKHLKNFSETFNSAPWHWQSSHPTHHYYNYSRPTILSSSLSFRLVLLSFRKRESNRKTHDIQPNKMSSAELGDPRPTTRHPSRVPFMTFAFEHRSEHGLYLHDRLLCSERIVSF